MSVLGALLGEGDVRRTEVTALREKLEDSLAYGLPFDMAWRHAVQHVRHTTGLGTLELAPPGDVSPLEFARRRFERAYEGRDPSVRTCQHETEGRRPCTSDAVRGSYCLLHAPLDDDWSAA